MIKLKDILNEKLKVDVQWVSKAYTFANDGKFPLTPTIGSILNEKQRVRAYHITSPTEKYIDNIASLEGSKKSISCMTRLPKSVTNRLGGVWHEGLMFYLEGTLVIKAKEDIMTEPDEQGRRWFSIGYIDSDLGNKWLKILRNDKPYTSLQSMIQNSINIGMDIEGMVGLNELYRQIIKRVVDLAESFTKKNKKIILKGLMKKSYSQWDEIVLNEIELIDAVYDVSSDHFVIAKNKKTIENKLKSIVSGNVYYVNTDDRSKAYEIISAFVSKRKVNFI